MTQSRQAAPAVKKTGRPPAVFDWDEVARTLAREFRATAGERERANRLPWAELRRLRESGLVNLRIPKKFGGEGAGLWPAARVVLEISKADPTLGFLLAFHYHTATIPRLLDYRHDGAAILRRSAKQRWFWGNVWQLRDPNLVAEPRPNGGFFLNGAKRWSSGAYLSDVVFVAARHRDLPRFVAVAIPARRKGLRYLRDWDGIGLRQTESETLAFKRVAVRPDEVLPQSRPFVGVPPFYGSLGVTLNAAFYLGTAFGALEAARDFAINQAKPRTAAIGQARNDPLLHALYGSALFRLQAGVALLEKVALEAEAAWKRRETISSGELGNLSARTASLLAYSAEVALEVTAKAFEASGGGSTATLARLGLDRYWRDVRTFSLHNPLSVTAINVGNHFLNGTMPPPPTFFPVAAASKPQQFGRARRR